MPTLTFNRPTRLNAWAFEIGDRYFDLARTDPDAPKHRGLTMLQVYVNGRVVHMTRTRMAANARARKAPEPEGSGVKLRTDMVKESRC